MEGANQFTNNLPMNTLTSQQNGGQLAEDDFEGIFLNEQFCILIKISLQFVAV